ncbi:M4 family metallopeptidase [Streptosporangium sp. NPDC051022]|uniref:M4 family metallopeptidase n=1 Tax=Streptosporangium sp. NPDC051022 TaxID=3155752 RepID=UPI003430C052
MKLGAIAAVAVAAMGAPALTSSANAVTASAAPGAQAAPPGGQTGAEAKAVLPAGPTGAETLPAFAPPGLKERERAIAGADRALLARAGELRRGPGEAFERPEVISGVRGLLFLTYRRTYHGLPVYGGDVIVATDRTGGVVHSVVTGQKARLDVATEARVGADAAASAARAELPVVRSAGTPRLVVHAATERPRLAWEVTVTGERERLPSVLNVFVDALDGTVFDTSEQVREGAGHGFYNGRVTIDTLALPGGGHAMTDPTRPGLSCGTSRGPLSKATDTWGDGNGTNPETACVDVVYAAQRQWDMLRDWLGRAGVTGTGRTFPARLADEQGHPYWNGSAVIVRRDSPGGGYVTPLDVIAHEYAHAVFASSGSGGEGSGNETGGLNESTGDIYGALTEHYAGNPNDPPDYTYGEEVNLAGTGPLRYMYNPALAGDPNCFSATVPKTEVHAAAGPQNHWFYLLAEGTSPGGGKPNSPTCVGSVTLTGIGIRKAGEIFQSGLNLKTLPWTHAKARAATVRAAGILYPGSCLEVNAVKAAWRAVNVPAQPGEPICD